MAQTVRKHALIIVDLQKDFLPGGALGVPGGDKAVPVIRAVLEDHPWDCVVMTQDWHPTGHVSFAVNHEGKHVLDVVDLPYGPPDALARPIALKGQRAPKSKASTSRRPTSSCERAGK